MLIRAHMLGDFLKFPCISLLGFSRIVSELSRMAELSRASGITHDSSVASMNVDEMSCDALSLPMVQLTMRFFCLSSLC